MVCLLQLLYRSFTDVTVYNVLLHSSAHYFVTWKGEGTWSVVAAKTIIGNEGGAGKDVKIKVGRKTYTVTIIESGTCMHVPLIHKDILSK